MAAIAMDHLDQLEHQSVYILREAYATSSSLCMLWSIGKDSTVLLWLARKAFFGHVPFPLVHIDTTYKIPEMIEYRDRLALEWKLQMVVRPEPRRRWRTKQTFPDGAVDRHRLLRRAQDRRAQAHAERRVAALAPQPQHGKYERRPRTRSRTPASSSARAPTRRAAARRSATSRRATATTTGTSATSRRSSGTSSRPTSRPARTCASTRCSTGPSSTSGSTSSARRSRRCRSTTTRATGKRYRSLGCGPCTHAVDSDADERGRHHRSSCRAGKFANIAERSGRAQDKADGGGLETLRRDGYM